MNLFHIHSKCILAILVLILAPVTPAFSTATITIGGTTASDHSGLTTSIPGASVTTFNNWSYPGNYHFTGDAHITQYLGAPASDTTPYVTTASRSVTIDFINPVEYFGLYWGNIDSANEVAFTDNFGNTYSYDGDTIADIGKRLSASSSQYVNFFSDFGETWKSVTLSSTRCTPFVFDNVASSTAPEPASLTTAGLGIGLAVFGVLRRKRSQARLRQ